MKKKSNKIEISNKQQNQEKWRKKLKKIPNTDEIQTYNGIYKSRGI